MNTIELINLLKKIRFEYKLFIVLEHIILIIVNSKKKSYLERINILNGK